MRSLSGSSPLDRLGTGDGRLLGLMALAANAGAAAASARTATATAATIRRAGTVGTKPILPPNPDAAARAGFGCEAGDMKHTRLGRTGLQVSRLCLGTMTFGVQCDEQTSFAILDAAAEGGITFLDTADVYPLGGGVDTVGRTEEIVGTWLQGQRDDYIVATKCVGRMGRRRWEQGASRKHIVEALDASLRRLGTDYVDLYQLHGPDPTTPIDETLEALGALAKAGKVRYVGCSNFLAYQVARALGRSEARSLVRFDSVQP